MKKKKFVSVRDNAAPNRLFWNRIPNGAPIRVTVAQSAADPKAILLRESRVKPDRLTSKARKAPMERPSATNHV